MKFLELASKIKEKVENVYLLSGEDSYLKQTAYKLIKRAAINEELSFLNESQFDNENWNVEKFEEAAYSMPMGCNYKLVHVKNLEKISDKEKQIIQNIINNISPSTCLVIELNKNLKLTGGTTVDCSSLDHATLVKYINGEVIKNGKRITQDAANMLIEFCSSSLTKIISELPKLCAYADEINTEAVKMLVAPDEEFQIYELTEALGNRNKDKSIKLLHLMLEKKETSLVSLISNHFRRVAFCSLSDYSNDELAEMFEVKPFAILKARNQSKFFSKVQLKNILALLEEVDFMVKSGKMQAENAIYYLVLKILHC